MKREPPEGIAFKVFQNGRGVCTAGLGGKPGVLTATLHWVDRQGRDELWLHVGGLESATQQHIIWAAQPLRIGDEVAIRILENVKPTRVRARTKLTNKSREEQEKAWLKKIAKKQGYKLVKL
ncbi:MAG TPA: hypothetical protein VEV17_14645 [Bryobacteraceae bacterium]|nr:hypothetical protein [Bryobacteraceae bacterium]